MAVKMGRREAWARFLAYDVSVLPPQGVGNTLHHQRAWQSRALCRQGSEVCGAGF